MPPDPPKRPRQQSRPDLHPRAIAGDEQPERAAVRHHPGLEGSEQAAPKRTTLTELPAVRPPERKPTLTGAPAPPPLPLEYAPTKRPPLPWGKTVRAESAPAVVAAARRTDPPPPSELPATSIRVTADETSPASLRKPSPLPAPSQRPDEGRIAAKDREIERLRRERDEARARPTIEMAPESEAPLGATKRDVRRALTGLLGGLTLLCSTIGIYIATRTEALKPKVDATATNTGINAADVTALTTRATAIEKYERDKYDHDVCVEQQLRAAIARGADHDLTTLPPGGTDWVQQHQPYRNRTAADPPAYIAIKPCPEAPKRP